MARYGGAGILPSGAYHLESPTTVTERDVEAWEVVLAEPEPTRARQTGPTVSVVSSRSGRRLQHLDHRYVGDEGIAVWAVAVARPVPGRCPGVQSTPQTGQCTVQEAIGRCRPRSGTAQLIRLPTQKMPTVGVPTAAATCSGPVSLETTTAQSA